MDSNLIFFQIQRDINDPKNINQVIQNITETTCINKNIDLQSLIESYQEKILNLFDKEKVNPEKGINYYIDCINQKTEKYVKKIIDNTIKYSIDSQRFDNIYSNSYEIELPKKYSIELENIEIERKEFNYFTCKLAFQNIQTKKIHDVHILKGLYTSENIYSLLSSNGVECTLENKIIFFDDEKYTFNGNDLLLNILNIYPENKKNISTYTCYNCNLIDIYIDGVFVKQTDIYNIIPFSLVSDKSTFKIDFFEANTNIPFEFHSSYKLNLKLL